MFTSKRSLCDSLLTIGKQLESVNAKIIETELRIASDHYQFIFKHQQDLDRTLERVFDQESLELYEVSAFLQEISSTLRNETLEELENDIHMLLESHFSFNEFIENYKLKIAKSAASLTFKCIGHTVELQQMKSMIFEDLNYCCNCLDELKFDESSYLLCLSKILHKTQLKLKRKLKNSNNYQVYIQE